MEKIDGEVFQLKKQNSEEVIISDKKINEKYKKGEIRIVTEQARYPIKSIKGMLASGDYKLNPEYQRRKRWDNVSRSKLIESFIMNVPLPPIFLYEYEYSKFEVMDGLQRLTSIDDFYQGKFKLEGLEYWKELNNKTYDELPSEIQKGIDRRYISSIVLLAETAKSEEEAEELKKIVFERLNSGGEKINPQETRNALYNGSFNQLCIKLSQNKKFRKMWNIPLESEGESKLLESETYRRMDDVEYVLRFFAYRFLKEWKDTKINFFNQYLQVANNFPSTTLKELENLFNTTIDILWEIFGKEAFIPNKLNKPALYIYDSLMQAISEYIDIKEKLIINKKNIAIAIKSEKLYKEEYNGKLLFDSKLDNKTIIYARIKFIKKLIEEVIND